MPIRIRDSAFSFAACEKLVYERNTGAASPHRLPTGNDKLQALKLMSSKISTLIVTDADKPVGIIHLHDLLRAGVA